MFNLIAQILAWFYELTHNYALAIGLLTISVMILLTPLTLKGTRSMIQMQRLQPEIKRIQNEFKGDRQRLNEELMKFYQENKINPLGGCLPLLIQAPVFGVLYRVVHKLTEECSAEQVANAVAKASGRCYAPGIIKPNTFGPSYISHTSELWKSLAGATKMMAFGIDLSMSTLRQISISFVGAIPFMILILLVGFTSWYQQRQIMARTKGQPSVIPAQQQAIMKFLPFMWPIFLLALPTGLAVYGLVSNLYRIGQQGFITRTMYSKDDGGGYQPAIGKGPKNDPDSPKPVVIPPKAKNRPAPTGKNGTNGTNGAKPADKPTPSTSSGKSTGKPTPKPKPKPAPRTQQEKRNP